MKRLVVVILMSVILAYSQVEWINRYPGFGSSCGEDIAVDGVGNVYVFGWGGNTGTSFDYLTIKYNSSGDTLWVRYYDGGASFYDYGNAMAVDYLGNVYVTGRSITSGNHYDIATLKYNTDGVLQWAAVYAGAYGDDDEGNDIVVDDSGYVYVTGYTYSLSTSTDYITIKYDNDGDTVWTARYNGAANSADQTTALALDGLGNLYVTGYCDAGGEDYFDCVTVKYDTAGNELWVVSYDGPALYADDRANDIACYGDFIYITGESEGVTSDADYLTIKYNSAGDTVWTLRYDGPEGSYDIAAALTVDDDGNVYITGESCGSGTSSDYGTIKYTSAGILEWTARYNGPASTGDQANAIAVDHWDNVFVTGRSYANEPYTPEYDYLTIKYDASGNEQWTARYDGTGHTQDEANAIVVDHDGYVCITGGSIGTTSYEDVVTIKYTASGIEEGAGHSLYGAGYALTVSPNPFSKLTTVSFGIEHSAESIELRIFDACGRLVRNLYRAMPLAPCTMQITWDGTDQVGRPLSSGVYFARLVAADHQVTTRILYIR